MLQEHPGSGVRGFEFESRLHQRDFDLTQRGTSVPASQMDLPAILSYSPLRVTVGIPLLRRSTIQTAGSDARYMSCPFPGEVCIYRTLNIADGIPGPAKLEMGLI